MQQIVRTMTMAEAGAVPVPQVLICNRDRKWSGDVRRRLGGRGYAGRLYATRAPNANAYAERFVRSIKEDWLHRLIPIGDRHFRRALTEYVEHYHVERNHQGLDNRLISRPPVIKMTGGVRRIHFLLISREIQGAGRPDPIEVPEALSRLLSLGPPRGHVEPGKKQIVFSAELGG